MRRFKSLLMLIICVSLFAGWGFPDNSKSDHSANAQVPQNIEVFLPYTTRFYTTEPTIFGMHFETISTRSLKKFVDTNTSWARKDLPWDLVEPVEGQRYWDAFVILDAELQRAIQQEIRVIGIIGSTPAWARKVGFYDCGGAIAPEKLAAFGQFVYDLVKRYAAAPYNMKYWELWNEPDVVGWLGCWGDEQDPYYGGRYYAEMLKVAYPKIKAADPDAHVLFGGLLLDCNPYDPPLGKTCIPGKFLEGALINNAGPYFDGVSFHAYDFYRLQYGVYDNSNFFSAWNTTGPILTAKANYIRFLLGKYGYPGKYLINSEVALLCDVCTEDSIYYNDFERTKVNYVVNAYANALAAGLKANIWYSASGWRNSGLLNSNSTPRPAFDAYRFASIQLGWATYIGPVTSTPLGGVTGLKGHQFKTLEGKNLWTLWSLDGLDHVVTLPGTPNRIWDGLGQEITVTNPLTVTLMPLYIEW